MVCAKYYEYSYRFCLNTQDRTELQDAFKTILNVDIVELVERISPLGFKFSFSSKQEEERARQIEEAIENDEKDEITANSASEDPEVKAFKISGKKSSKK
jgi:hypothetical protein